MKVYNLQKHGDWRQEKLSHADILQRLAQLDLDPLGVLDKKLKIPTKYQARIDAIQTKVNGEEANHKNYEWNLRQLELKEKRFARLSFGRSWSLLAIIVYLEREAQQLDREQDICAIAQTEVSPEPVTFSTIDCVAPLVADGQLLIHDQVGNMVLDKHRALWTRKRVDTDKDEDDPFSEIPDLPVDTSKELHNARLDYQLSAPTINIDYDPPPVGSNNSNSMPSQGTNALTPPDRGRWALT